MKGAVLRKVKSEKLAEQYESYTSGLRSGATVTVDDSKAMALALNRLRDLVLACREADLQAERHG